MLKTSLRVGAKVTFDPDGVVRAKEITAHGVTGALTAQGEVHFDGLRFQKATASANIAKRDAMPIAIEGQSLAQAWGKFSVVAVPAPHPGEIDVTARAAVNPSGAPGD